MMSRVIVSLHDESDIVAEVATFSTHTEIHARARDPRTDDVDVSMFVGLVAAEKLRDALTEALDELAAMKTTGSEAL